MIQQCIALRAATRSAAHASGIRHTRRQPHTLTRTRASFSGHNARRAYVPIVQHAQAAMAQTYTTAAHLSAYDVVVINSISDNSYSVNNPVTLDAASKNYEFEQYIVDSAFYPSFSTKKYHTHDHSNMAISLPDG